VVTLALGSMAAIGMYLLLLPMMRFPHDRPGRQTPRRSRRSLVAWMRRSGLDHVSPRQFVAVSIATGVASAVASAAMLGAGIPAAIIGLAAATAPATAWRRRRSAARDVARESWPRIIEEIRVLTGSAGRPVPQALFEAGLRGPHELHGAFAAAQREWALTTDFGRATAELKGRLEDPAADAVCETLLVVHEVGGDLDRRLAALAEDRRIALRDHKEAEVRLAGARLARWFVVVVPIGMAFAGLSLGEGAAAYRTVGGQAASGIALGLVAVCWWWAGRIMTVPTERRVFDR